MLKCVMFDLGSTLLDSWDEALCVRLYASLIREKGCKVKIKDVANARLMQHRTHILKYRNIPHMKHNRHLYMIDVMKRLGCKFTDTEVSEMGDKFRKIIAKRTKLYPGTRNVLSLLKRKKMKIALVSNAMAKHVNAQLKKYKILKYFDTVVVSSSVGNEKSSLVPFKIVLKRLNLKPRECLMVGDQPDEDMYAKKLGIWTCHATYGPKSLSVGRKVKPDFRINDIRKLPKVIEKLSD